MKLLHIKVSHSGPNSFSRQVSQYLMDKVKREFPEVEETIMDLSLTPIPHLSALTISAFFTRPDERTPEQNEAIHLSDHLVDQLLETDMLIVSSPMWNLGLPSVLKAWFDHVTRAGRTFAFTPQGTKVGLVKDKRVIAVLASGSMFTEGDFMDDDQFSPYFKKGMSYIGIENVQIIRVEGTAIPDKAELALPKAYKIIDQLVFNQ